MFDIDTFFIKEDYEKILNIVKNVNDNEIYTFDLAKLDDNNLDFLYNNGVFDLNSVHWNYAYSGDKKNGPFGSGHSGGIGGVYICDMNLIKSVGGFNEEYIGWGGEDGDMMGRLYESKKISKLTPVRDFAPIHLSHFIDWSSDGYSKRFKD
jgi:predicted glycosyltransferase involved in capsule biosynthesis